MKRTIQFLLVTLILAANVPFAMAQSTQKELKKELKAKVDKESKKTAKQLTKDGWKVMPGKLSIEKQVQAAKYAELSKDDNNEKFYFIGTHQATGGNYSAAKQIADSRARLELAQAVHTTITQKVEEKLANTDFGDKDIVVVDEFISANKNIVAARLSGATPVLEIYREVSGNVETMVVVQIKAEDALKQAKQGYRDELMQKSEKLAQDLDKLLPY